MNQVAAILYVAHDAAALRAVRATGADVYTLTREGKLATVQGPEVKLVAHLQATQVVWAGVPRKWVGKLGSLPFKSTYVGGRRWSRVTDAMDVVKKIASAKKAAEAEGIKVEQERRKAHADRVRAARLAALFSPPPIYIPQELR